LKKKADAEKKLYSLGEGHKNGGGKIKKRNRAMNVVGGLGVKIPIPPTRQYFKTAFPN